MGWGKFRDGLALDAVLCWARFFGLLLAPRLQRWGRFFGVDPYELAPALVVIACAGVLGGVVLVRSKLWR